MVPTEPPKAIIQWDKRFDAKEKKDLAICFYSNDYTFQSVLGNPMKYIDYLKEFSMVIGPDASPYDNMPLVVQKSQIFLNVAITYYWGLNGIKVIPNIRLGDGRTLSSLEAYPKNTLIAIGTNGFTKSVNNRCIFSNQVKTIVDALEPTGICVYGPTPNSIFEYARKKDIPIYQYNSYMMNRNRMRKKNEGIN